LIVIANYDRSKTETIANPREYPLTPLSESMRLNPVPTATEQINVQIYNAIMNDYAITLYTKNAAAVPEMLNDNFWPTGILSYWCVTTAQPLLPLQSAC